MYTRPTAPGLILVTRLSCVDLANSIKGVGSYLSYHRSHYALLFAPIGHTPTSLNNIHMTSLLLLLMSSLAQRCTTLHVGVTHSHVIYSWYFIPLWDHPKLGTKALFYYTGS